MNDGWNWIIDGAMPGIFRTNARRGGRSFSRGISSWVCAFARAARTAWTRNPIPFALRYRFRRSLRLLWASMRSCLAVNLHWGFISLATWMRSAVSSPRGRSHEMGTRFSYGHRRLIVVLKLNPRFVILLRCRGNPKSLLRCCLDRRHDCLDGWCWGGCCCCCCYCCC